MEILITLGAIAGAIVFFFAATGMAIKQFYIVPEADEALVKTGGKTTVVAVGGGVYVIPLFHRVAKVSLQAIQIPIERVAENALPTSDKLMAEVRGELFVQVNPKDNNAIIQAVQSVGTTNPSEMANRVRLKIDSLVTDALRTAAFQKSFLELNSEKKQFADEVIALLQEDLSRLGLTLTAVSIPHIYQGQFTTDEGDVFAAEGRRNVAETVARNMEQTNKINREAEIKIQQQDVEAREQALGLSLKRKQKEADNSREVVEYEAQQRALSETAVLTQNKAIAEATATQGREVATKEIEEQRQIDEAKIAKSRSVAVAQAEAEAIQADAEATADAAKAEADAKRQVAREEGAQTGAVAEIAKDKAIKTAEIARNKSIEEAAIAKDQAVKVADQERQQAIQTAEVSRSTAVATQQQAEADALALKAFAGAKQREAEESVTTVTETKIADRTRQVAIIHAEQDAEQEKIEARKSAFVTKTAAEGKRQAAEETAIAVKTVAEGEANATRARAQAAADKITIEATAYATHVTTRAEAEHTASTKQAEARKALATALEAEGKAEAESRRLLVEAENAIAPDLLYRDVALAAIEQAPAIAREIMAPVAEVSKKIQIVQVDIGGSGDGESGGLPAKILETGFATAGLQPLLAMFANAFTGNPDIQLLAETAKDAAKSALSTAVDRATEGKTSGNGVERDRPTA